MDDELLTTTEIAEIFKVDERTILNYRNLKINPLPSIKLGGAIRFRRSAVDRWLEERENDG